MTPNTVICLYCEKPAKLVGGMMIYPHRPDLATKNFYECRPCGAYVGCHPGTAAPLGRLADAALRAAKQRVHAAFDPYWKGTKNRTRGNCYKRLARDMGIEFDACHVGMFDLAMCERALSVIRTWGTPPTARYTQEGARP